MRRHRTRLPRSDVVLQNRPFIFSVACGHDLPASPGAPPSHPRGDIAKRRHTLNTLALLCCVGIQCATSAFADEPKKVAFVDTGNTGRSVMAEAIAGQLIAQRHARTSR